MEEKLRQLARRYIPAIEKVYAGQNQNLPESELLSELLKLLAELPQDFHVFCDKDVGPISIFCLTIFSFNDQDTISWLKEKFNPALAKCDDCVVKFARGKCQMLQHFAIQRHVPHEHVSKFNDIVCHWRISVLVDVLKSISNDTHTSVQITEKIEVAMFECLCNPHMLRLNKNLKAIFDVIFRYFYETQNKILQLRDSSLVAGVVYCWCEGSSEENNWSKGILIECHKRKTIFTLETITPDILEEINVHLLFLQDPTNWNEVVVSQFWSRLNPILSLLHNDIFIKFFMKPPNEESLKKSFKFPIQSIFKLWYSHLGQNYRDKPLAFLLRALSMFLEKFGPDFWDKIEPFTFHSILDLIFDKGTFGIKLTRIQNNPIPSDDLELYFSLTDSITDLVSWTLPFYRALTSSKRIQMVRKVSMAFLRIIASHPSLNSISKACLINSSTALLRAVLTIKETERLMLYDKDDFETILYTKTDSRALMGNPLVQDIIIRTITSPREIYPDLGDSITLVSTSAMMVLTQCITFDILLLCQLTFKLYKRKPINEFPWSHNLMVSLVEKIDLRSFHDGSLLAKQLMASLRDINGLLLVPVDTPVVKNHNNKIKEFLDLSTKLVEKFADIPPAQMHRILSEKDAAKGFWSCIFSSDTSLYQAATNILYDTYDVEGRLEGIQAILKENFTAQLAAINAVIAQLIKCEFYEPCPRAVRVLMDVMRACTDPVTGTFSNFDSLKDGETVKELDKFWQKSWRFLDTIYRCTLPWASSHEYSELENFTKDTLDLSHSLVDSYREVSNITNNTDEEIFSSILLAFKDMLYWLRLSDDVLLDSCVRLITSTSDLAKEKSIKFDDTLVDMMARYASKAKKFSNKLSSSQATEILMKARSFNSVLTDQVIASVESYKKEREASKLHGSTSSSSASPQPPMPVESRADFLQRKALSSSITTRPRKSQPKITSFGTLQPGSPSLSTTQNRVPKALSKMEQARRQLLTNRVVHPPSTSVFNTKPTVKPSPDGDSSSDESDGDIETARELFATTKPKDKGIQTLDIDGKSIKRNNLVNSAKLEQENMRKRLNIDLNPLYETILKWDYTSKSEYPDDEDIQRYSDVKDVFASTLEYQKIMRPLLLLECWQGLCSARDREDNKPFSIVIGNRITVSDFYEIYASINKQMVQFSGITESDLIVLAVLDGEQKRISNEDFRRANDTCLAKIKTLKNTKGGNVDITLRVHRSHKFSKFLTLRSEIHAVKAMQMTTVEREYTTLEGLEYYDLVQQILQAKPTEQEPVSSIEVDLVQRNYKLNKSQAEAIVNSVTKSGFSLIQGPPGTGKTKTILGAVGYFLSTRSTIPSNVIKAPTGPGSNSNLSTDQMLRKQKLLICAPSNAAVDEICLRLKDGVSERNGGLMKPRLVRVGRSDAVNAAIKDLTLEELVDKQVGDKNYEFTSNPELDRKFSSIVNKRRELRAKLDAENGSVTSKLSTEDIAKLQLDIRTLSKQLNDLARERDEIREKNNINYRNRDLDRRNAQARILAGCDIICSTLSGSAHDVLASLGVKFDTVVIDEACQCTELSAIIPLRYGGKRCIMVGDPNQLPPTVLSGAASNFNYNQSLFVRMEKNCSPYLLDVQYRMHPMISRFPSLEFYNGRLKDGPNLADINARPWHENSILGPYKFFDIATGRQQQNVKTMSYTNAEEVKVAIEMIDFLLKKYESSYDFRSKIGIISPYKEQMGKMKRDFVHFFGNNILTYIDFNTIDGFQGQEKEIILISCVRATDTGGGVGFLRDFRRLNVALTRAKTSMWILGHHRSLYQNKLWKHLIDDAQDRKCLQVAHSQFLTQTDEDSYIPKYEPIKNTEPPMGSKKKTSGIFKKPPLNTMSNNSSSSSSSNGIPYIKNKSEPLTKPTDVHTDEEDGYVPTLEKENNSATKCNSRRHRNTAPFIPRKRRMNK